MAMLKKLLASRWHAVKTGVPGQRFRRRYYRRRETNRGALMRSLQFLVGIVLIPVGLFFMPAPGPGILILLVGATLAARESLMIARALDAGEVAVRKLLSLGQRLWRRSSWWVRAPALVAASATLAALLVAGWLLAPNDWKGF